MTFGKRGYEDGIELLTTGFLYFDSPRYQKQKYLIFQDGLGLEIQSSWSKEFDPSRSGVNMDYAEDRAYDPMISYLLD